MIFFSLTGTAVVRQCGGVKKLISGEGSFLQMLDVLRKGKLMTMKNLLQAAFWAALQSDSDADLMQKCNNDLSINIPRAKSLHTLRRTNRIKNYPPYGKYINPPADTDPLLTDLLLISTEDRLGIWRWWCFLLTAGQRDGCNKQGPWPSGLLDDGCVAPGTGPALISRGGLYFPVCESCYIKVWSGGGTWGRTKDRSLFFPCVLT